MRSFGIVHGRWGVCFQGRVWYPCNLFYPAYSLVLGPGVVVTVG